MHNPNTFFEVNHLLSTSPTREDFWEHIMMDRQMLSIDENGRVTRANTDRNEDFNKLMDIVSGETDLLKISNIIYNMPWSATQSEEPLVSYCKERGEFIVEHLTSSSYDDMYLQQFNVKEPKDFRPCNSYPAEILILTENAEQFLTDSKEFKEVFEDFAFNFNPSDGDYRMLKHLKDLIPSGSDYHSRIDSLIKRCRLWNSGDTVCFTSSEDRVHLNIEWLLSGFFYPGGNKVSERSVFTYFRSDVGLNVEEYLESILSSSMTENDIRFLLLVIYTRSLPVVFHSWIGASMMPLLSTQTIEALRKVISASEIWPELNEANQFNSYEKDTLKMIGLR